MATFLQEPQIRLVQTKMWRRYSGAETHRSPYQLRGAESLCETHRAESTFVIFLEVRLRALAQSLGVMLTPVDILYVGNEQFAVVAFGEIPLIEAEIIVGFCPPMGRPLAKM